MTGTIRNFAEWLTRSSARQRQASPGRRNELMSLSLVAQRTNDLVLLADRQGRILWVNDAFERVIGLRREDVRGRRASELITASATNARAFAAMRQALGIDEAGDTGGAPVGDGVRAEECCPVVCGQLHHRGPGGREFWFEVEVQRLCPQDEQGGSRSGAGRGAGEESIELVAVATDITQRRKANEAIHRLRHYDALTGLPNRRLLRERLTRAIGDSAATGRHGAVLLVDLDRFKQLNDAHGPETGDLLLVATARSLARSVRGSDTVSRYGSDEFIVVLSGLAADAGQAADQARRVADALRAALNQPRDLAGRAYLGSASIGVHLFTGREQTSDELLQRAARAADQARHAGRNRIEFFDERIHLALRERAALETDLPRALDSGQLQPYLQAQVDADGRTTGAELLLRWRHPQLGLIAPAVFVPIAEESGAIVALGERVLRQACTLLAQWAKQPGLQTLRLSVNVSPKQFHDDAFVDRVGRALADTGVDPRRLRLELTESVVALDVDETIATMQRVRALGVGFSIDDFGTGHSSLSYLSRLPIDELKIDQSFVRNMMHIGNDAVLVQAIIGMAQALSIEVVAEGVETAAQRSALARCGCRRFQGYLFGRPVPVERFVRRQTSRRWTPPREMPFGQMSHRQTVLQFHPAPPISDEGPFGPGLREHEALRTSRPDASTTTAPDECYRSGPALHGNSSEP